jgi:hypothetical protein
LLGRRESNNGKEIWEKEGKEVKEWKNGRLLAREHFNMKERMNSVEE